MQHKCRVTVIRTEVYEDLQAKYLKKPKAGPCPFYKVGREFIFERYGGVDDYMTCGRGDFCSEAWDAISRFIYCAIHGGSIMRNWTNDEKMMIANCSSGTRPVFFKIERLDYKVLVLDCPLEESHIAPLEAELKKIGVTDIGYRDWFIECYVDNDMDDKILVDAAEKVGLKIKRVD